MWLCGTMWRGEWCVAPLLHTLYTRYPPTPPHTHTLIYCALVSCAHVLEGGDMWLVVLTTLHWRRRVRTQRS